MELKSWQQEVWEWVAAVPPGKVASYGQIARLAGYPRHARHVGVILRQLPAGTRLPWHRILRSSGEPGVPAGSPAHERQCALLAAEGVAMSGGRVDFRHYGWRP